MGIDLYYMGASAPCRAVALVAAALDVQLNLIELDLMKGEQNNAEFTKLNPQHTVPTIVDEGFSIWESRAIARYLANKYGADSALYPREPQARALVDQRLDFDLGTLYTAFGDYFYPQAFEGAKPDEALFKTLDEVLNFLNTFLEGSQYVAGAELTLADLSIVATVSTIEAADIGLAAYPNVLRWFDLVKSTAPKYQEANQKGVDEFKQLIVTMKANKT